MNGDELLDGCDLDFDDDALTDDEQALFPLFPDGPDDEKAAEWRRLFEGR